MKFVDPKNDVAFRKIFGDENKKEILISFLNNILGFAGTDKEITDITIQNPYQVPKLKGLKETILSWSKEELDAYDTRGMLIQDERGRVEHAHEDGLKKGFEKGKVEEKRAIARAMLKEGMDIETISRLTGLGIDEIEVPG